MISFVRRLARKIPPLDSNATQAPSGEMLGLRLPDGAVANTRVVLVDTTGVAPTGVLVTRPLTGVLVERPLTGALVDRAPGATGAMGWTGVLVDSPPEG